MLNSEKELIVVDIDDSAADMTTHLVDFHNSKYGTNLKNKDVIAYDLTKVWGGDREESLKKINEFYDSHYFDRMIPMENAIEVIKNLKSKYNLVIITSRPPSVKKKTEEWVEKHFPRIFSDIYFTNHNVIDNKEKIKEKVDICNEIGAKIIIEDSLRNAFDCASKGMKVFLFETSSNIVERPKEMPKNIIPISSWKEILNNLN